MKRTYKLKNKYDKGLCPSDIAPDRKNLGKLLLFGFIAGIVGGALGLAGGTIYNPLLINMNVAP